MSLAYFAFGRKMQGLSQTEKLGVLSPMIVNLPEGVTDLLDQ